MLREIRIRDLGVIDDATLPFAPGLNVLTGETGAGKTMVVQGLGLLLGGRASAGLVREGAASCVVEGVLDLPADHPAVVRADEAGGELDEGELLLARSVAEADVPEPGSAAATPRWGCSARSVNGSSPCTARPTSGDCNAPISTARCSTTSAAKPSAPAWSATPQCTANDSRCTRNCRSCAPTPANERCGSIS